MLDFKEIEDNLQNRSGSQRINHKHDLMQKKSLYIQSMKHKESQNCLLDMKERKLHAKMVSKRHQKKRQMKIESNHSSKGKIDNDRQIPSTLTQPLLKRVVKSPPRIKNHLEESNREKLWKRSFLP